MVIEAYRGFPRPLQAALKTVPLTRPPPILLRPSEFIVITDFPNIRRYAVSH